MCPRNHGRASARAACLTECSIPDGWTLQEPVESLKNELWGDENLLAIEITTNAADISPAEWLELAEANLKSMGFKLRSSEPAVVPACRLASSKFASTDSSEGKSCLRTMLQPGGTDRLTARSAARRITSIAPVAQWIRAADFRPFPPVRCFSKGGQGAKRFELSALFE